MATDLYPFVFRPVLVPRPWAGNFMKSFLEEGYGQLSESPGEAWLLFDDGKRSSIIANGNFAQASLGDLIRSRADELVGRRHASRDPFPLSIRLIDTLEDQPLQVHPDTENPSETNTKFWYSLTAQPRAKIIDGIAQEVTNQQILLNLHKPVFNRLLQHYPGRPGDSYLVPPGFVHSIGAGNLVLEIQQRYIQPLVLETGAETARKHPLDQQAALSAINREARTNLRISREAGHTSHTRRIKLTSNCPYFQVEEIRLKDHIFLRTKETSFNLIVVTQGHAAIKWQTTAIDLKPGMLCCIPAVCGDYKIVTMDGPSELLCIKNGPGNQGSS